MHLINSIYPQTNMSVSLPHPLPSSSLHTNCNLKPIRLRNSNYQCIIHKGVVLLKYLDRLFLASFIRPALFFEHSLSHTRAEDDEVTWEQSMDLPDNFHFFLTRHEYQFLKIIVSQSSYEIVYDTIMLLNIKKNTKIMKITVLKLNYKNQSFHFAQNIASMSTKAYKK